MKVFIKIIAAFVLLTGNLLAFQTSSWGIEFITDHYWVRFIHPFVASFIFAGIVTNSFGDYFRPWKIKKEANPTRWAFVAALLITLILAFLIE